MTKKNIAIEALNELLSDLDLVSSIPEGDTWKSRLKDTLTLYCGDNSEISKRLDKLFFFRHVLKKYEGKSFRTTSTIPVYDESKKESFRDLINNAISYIQANGVMSSVKKNNLLSEFSNETLIGALIFIIGTSLALGNYFGKLEKDKEIIEANLRLRDVEKENKDLQFKLKQLLTIKNKKKADMKL